MSCPTLNWILSTMTPVQQVAYNDFLDRWYGRK